MNIDITGALFTLWIPFEYTRTQCKEGASEVNFHWWTPMKKLLEKKFILDNLITEWTDRMK